MTLVEYDLWIMRWTRFFFVMTIWWMFGDKYDYVLVLIMMMIMLMLMMILLVIVNWWIDDDLLVVWM